MLVQDRFKQLHDAFAAALADSARIQATLVKGDDAIETWKRMAQGLEARADGIDHSLVALLHAIEAASGEIDPSLH